MVNEIKHVFTHRVYIPVGNRNNKQSFTSGYVQGTRNIEMKGCGPWLRESRGLLGKMEKKGDIVNCLSRGMDKKVTMKRRE